jgi:hypothetical protein
MRLPIFGIGHVSVARAAADGDGDRGGFTALTALFWLQGKQFARYRRQAFISGDTTVTASPPRLMNLLAPLLILRIISHHGAEVINAGG